MERQVIDSGAEIDVLWVRLPHNLEAEKLFIESARARKVKDTECQMAKASMEWSRHSKQLVRQWIRSLHSREMTARPSMGNQLQLKG
jgi:hypothetical protein